MTAGQCAFVDESAFPTADGRSVYILAATLIEPPAVEACTEAMSILLPRGGGKLHWGKEGLARQELISSRVASLGLSHLVVVRTTGRAERLERQRRKCMEELCCNLDQLGVLALVIESRGSADDLRDVAVLQTLRAQQRLGSRLRMRHERGPAEPLLWIPDAVCGAYRAGNTHWARFRSRSTVVEVA